MNLIIVWTINLIWIYLVYFIPNYEIIKEFDKKELDLNKFIDFLTSIYFTNINENKVILLNENSWKMNNNKLLFTKINSKEISLIISWKNFKLKTINLQSKINKNELKKLNLNKIYLPDLKNKFKFIISLKFNKNIIFNRKNFLNLIFYEKSILQMKIKEINTNINIINNLEINYENNLLLLILYLFILVVKSIFYKYLFKIKIKNNHKSMIFIILWNNLYCGLYNILFIYTNNFFNLFPLLIFYRLIFSLQFILIFIWTIILKKYWKILIIMSLSSVICLYLNIFYFLFLNLLNYISILKNIYKIEISLKNYNNFITYKNLLIIIILELYFIELFIYLFVYCNFYTIFITFLFKIILLLILKFKEICLNKQKEIFDNFEVKYLILIN